MNKPRALPVKPSHQRRELVAFLPMGLQILELLIATHEDFQ
jgi:hypothetical protein